MHLYEYFKEWRKNPRWSLSCCLALLLPLINLPGEINGLAGTNVTNTQLDTGQIELTTVAGAMKDSGAIDVTLDKKEQDDDNPTEVNVITQLEERSATKDAQLQSGEGQIPTILRDVKDSETVNDTLEHNEQGEGIYHELGYNNRKCHQATQTESSANFLTNDVGNQEPVEETRF